MAYEIVVVGTSWGGLAAIRRLIAGLPSTFALATVIVQHRHRDSANLLSSLLQDHTALCVCDAEDKAPIVGGNVYLAPADYHLLVEHGQFSLSTDEAVYFSRPSIDVTFTSVADAYREHAVGVILTGANSDGAAGLRRIHDRGGLTFVQRPETAESAIMPTAARWAVPRARVLSIPDISESLAALPAAMVSRSAAT